LASLFYLWETMRIRATISSSSIVVLFKTMLLKQCISTMQLVKQHPIQIFQSIILAEELLIGFVTIFGLANRLAVLLADRTLRYVEVSA